MEVVSVAPMPFSDQLVKYKNKNQQKPRIVQFQLDILTFCALVLSIAAQQIVATLQTFLRHRQG
jgi:hypothetical protein